MTKKITLSLFSIIIFLVSFSGVTLIASEKANAIGYIRDNVCTNFVDDFSTPDNWNTLSNYNPQDVSNGQLNVQYTGTDYKSGFKPLYFSEYNSTTNEPDVHVLYGDWTLDVDVMDLYDNYYELNDFSNEFVTSIVLSASSTNTFDYQVSGIALEKRTFSETNIVTVMDSEVSVPNSNDVTKITQIKQWDNAVNEPMVKLRVEKKDGILTNYYSLDNGATYEKHTSADAVADEYYVRLTVRSSSKNTSNYHPGYLLDNFKVTCGDQPVVDPIPTPDPVDPIDTTTPFNVQRFFNIRIGSAHFYSIDPVEAKFVEDNSKAGGLWPGAFVKEAPTFAAFNYDSVNDKCMDGTSPVYRYLNRTTGDTHFYAIKADEISAVEGQFASTFKPEGVSFCAYLNEATNTIPVLRWQNIVLGSTHFYSGSETERDVVDTQLTDMFRYEGISFYAMPVQ